MNEMEPAGSFSLTLRGYQKQALLFVFNILTDFLVSFESSWMHSLETGSLDAREATSMHPLWSQYVFRNTFKSLQLKFLQIPVSTGTCAGRVNDRSDSRRASVLF